MCHLPQSRKPGMEKFSFPFEFGYVKDFIRVLMSSKNLVRKICLFPLNSVMVCSFLYWDMEFLSGRTELKVAILDSIQLWDHIERHGSLFFFPLFSILIGS